jgi:hypothetical protein
MFEQVAAASLSLSPFSSFGRLPSSSLDMVNAPHEPESDTRPCSLEATYERTNTLILAGLSKEFFEKDALEEARGWFEEFGAVSAAALSSLP